MIDPRGVVEDLWLLIMQQEWVNSEFYADKKLPNFTICMED